MSGNWWEELGQALDTSHGTGLTVTAALDTNRAFQRGDQDGVAQHLKPADTATAWGLEQALNEQHPPGALGLVFMRFRR